MFKLGAINLLGAIARLALSLMLTAGLRARLGEQHFGLWVLLSTFINVAALAEAGIPNATAQFLAAALVNRNRAHIGAIVSSSLLLILALGFLAGGLVPLAGAVWLHTFHPHQLAQQPELITALIWCGVAVSCRLWQQWGLGIVQAFGRYDVSSVLQTVFNALLTVILLAVASSNQNLAQLSFSMAVLGALGMGLITALAAQWLAQAGMIWQWSRREGQRLARYAGLAWLSHVGGALLNQSGRLVVGAMLGPVALGVYGPLQDLLGQINALSAMVAQPLVTRIGQGASTPGLQPAVRQALLLSTLISLGLSAGLIGTAPWFLPLLLQTPIEPQVLWAFQAACVLVGAYSLNAVGYYLMQGTAQGAIIQLSGGAAALAVTVIGAHFGGLPGAMWGALGYQRVWCLTSAGIARFGVDARQELIYMLSALAGLALASGLVFPAVANETTLVLATLYVVGLAIETVRRLCAAPNTEGSRHDALGSHCSSQSAASLEVSLRHAIRQTA